MSSKCFKLNCGEVGWINNEHRVVLLKDTFCYHVTYVILIVIQAINNHVRTFFIALK